MVYDSSLYVEKLAWDPSVYVNTPAVFGEKKTPGHPDVFVCFDVRNLLIF